MAVRADDVDLRRDRDLVERFQGGDPSAFGDLYDRYFDRLCRFCQRRVFDRDVAEEIAQEAFYRALRALPRFAGEQRFYPWLTVIAGRLCIDHFRERSRVDSVAEVDAGVVPGADAPVLERAAVELLGSALERVKPRHKQVLALRDDEELSYQAIGDHLQAPVTTVEALLHRARHAVRRELVALSGPGAWASVPALAWARRVVGRLRVRLAERQAELSLVGAPLVAAAVTVSLAVAPGPSAGGLPGPAAGRTATSVSAPPVVDGPSQATGEPGEGPQPPVAGVAPAPAAAEVDPPALGAGPLRVYVGPEGADAAEDEAEKMPLNQHLGPAFFGADTDAVVDDVEDVGGQPSDTVEGGEPCVVACSSLPSSPVSPG